MKLRSLPIAFLFLNWCANAQLVVEDFEAGGRQWEAVGESTAATLREPSTDNTVLKLTPRRGALSYVLFETPELPSAFEMTGRILFPTDGDGYVGFIYSHVAGAQRTDYGCVYLKSNGSYIRFSPHFDGNPSWRLFEELRVNIDGRERIRTKRWYSFRLVVDPGRVSLYIDNLETPVFSTDVIGNAPGRVGLEARPGGGEPVWVDDIAIRELAAPAASSIDSTRHAEQPGSISNWQVLNEPVGETNTNEMPETPAGVKWLPAMEDNRGAVITGAHALFLSSKQRGVLLRASFSVDNQRQEAMSRLHFSSANELQVWLNGKFVGHVDPQDYIWSDHVSNEQHAGATIAITPRRGENELHVLVKGGRFAGGGFFAAIEPE